MFSQSIRTRLVLTAALLIVGLSGTLVAADEVLRLTRNIPGDSKPIVLHADAAATWSEGGQRVILLSGNVLVEHGVFNLRCSEAVIWTDEDSFKKTRVLHVKLYAEGNVVAENGTKIDRVGKAMIDLYSRGELRLKAQGGKVVQQPQVEDALYLRALAEKAPPAAPVDKTAANPPAAPKTNPQPPSSALQRAGFQDSSLPPPGPPGAAGAGPAPTPPGAAVFPSPGSVPPAPAPFSVPSPGAGPLQPPPSIGASPYPGAAAVQPGLPGAPAFGNPSYPGPPTLQPGGPPAAPPGVLPLPHPGPSPGSAAIVPRAPPNGPPRIVTLAPRTAKPFEWQSFPLPTGEQAIVATGGVSLMVRNLQNMEMVDIEADRLVFWSHGNSGDLFHNMRSSQGQTTKELEFYLAGNVEIRQQSRPNDGRVLRAEQVYYDVARNVAVAVSADLELRRQGVAEPIHFKADEILQLSPSMWEATHVQVFASRLPSDPGLKVYMSHATVEEEKRPRRSIFGSDVVSRQTGQVEASAEHFFRGESVFFYVEDVPIFYALALQGRAERPLGPLIDATAGYNRIFGFQGALTFDLYDLLGLDPIKNTRWRLDVDYLSKRGPALGQKFDYSGDKLFGPCDHYEGFIHAYGIHDTGEDILGGIRNSEDHPQWRGLFQWRHNWWGLPDGFTVQAQLNALSDKNFLEQYYKNDFDTDYNQSTFLYVKQQQGVWAWDALVQPRIRNWVTETEWLPRLDGQLLGVSFFDRFTYNAHASAGYAQLRPTDEFPPPIQATQARVNTGRFDVWQELSLPFYVGPIKTVPYGIIDLSDWTEDLAGNNRGRVIGAGGVRASMPLTRLYPDVCSELFNVNGINHKIVISGNFYAAHSDTHFSELPQLDPMNDDATDQAIRDINPLQPVINPKNGLFLATSPLFNPQTFAIRQLVDTRVETLDTIEVLQADIRQRWQTKRGYPGMQHIVDWMVLDVSANYYPNANRDNFGDSLAFIQYDWTWNIGDRTALVSTGWIDPHSDGPREYTLGMYLSRTDRTNFFLGYRQIDPLQSKAVTGAVSYVFSPKYAMTGSTVYDFGTSQALSNSLVLTRIGSDLQVSIGITYNALQNNFGATFLIVPNLMPANRRYGAGVNPFAH